MSDNTINPKDWSDWEKYRDQVIHPATTIKPEDIARAQENIQKHDWAKSYTDTLRETAEEIAQQISPAYLDNMIETTTPGCVGPCPACRAKGLPWHPNGQWSWSPEEPNNLQCSVCKTVFPNAEFPEDIAITSTWGGVEQTFTFVGGDTFKCFAYHQARPSISGITRVRKVQHISSQLQNLARAYVLTNDTRYAHAAKTILLRFAHVFPTYLVRAGYGYGEYAGMDPKIAAEHILDLPQDELVYPPNTPDRKIFAGYWAASRIGTSGMDGGWVVRMADAYSLTCTAQDNGKPIYTHEERLKIERDLLLESTYLAACDTSINNKSVGNRAGAAVVGMCVGHPGLVHFGLDGFVKTVNDWFLPDGGTSESPAYAMMTMNGIKPFALAFRDYSDPIGYQTSTGIRLDHFNACRDTLYGDCWQALIYTLQGDLHFPPSADSYQSTTISVSFADLLTLAYPTNTHIALLKELAAKDPSEGADQAIFNRDPHFANQTAPPLNLPDVVFPYLSQGYLHTGDDGRKSLVSLNAADHANHHHIDGLGLYYWKDGRELLSDLGYLWDHPDKYQTARTGAHNLVMIDGKDQLSRGRHGTFHLFSVTPTIKAMEASSDGYGSESTYQRTLVQIDHGSAGSYLLDIFRASGGQTADYIFHGPTNTYQVNGLNLTPSQPVNFGENGLDLTDIHHAQQQNPWHISYTYDDGYTFEAFAPGSANESIFIGNGWGQRDHRNTDVGATLPYVIRRVEGQNRKDIFVSAFVGNQGKQTLVKSIQVLPLPSNAPQDAIAIAVQTAHGTDIVVSQLQTTPITLSTEVGDITTDARLATLLINNGSPSSASLTGGTNLSTTNIELTAPNATLSGRILSNESLNGNSYFDLDSNLPHIQNLQGQTLFAIDDTNKHGYPIRHIEPTNTGCRVFTKHNHQGFEARHATRWEIPVTTTWSA